jgi:Uma2 family endonuclease
MENTTLQVAPMAGQSLLLEGVDWQTYSRLLKVFSERPRIRLTYDRGRLEIMSPLLRHDNDSRFLFRLVEALTEELELPLLTGGATTLRRRLQQRGAEPGECFWIASADRLTDNERLDLRRDPPPDLAVEVDVTSSSINRMPIYAALGVPEVWRLVGDELTFHIRNSRGRYRRAAHSRSFPQVAPTDLLPFIQEARKKKNQNPLLRRFRKWVRQHHNIGPATSSTEEEIP